MSLLLLTQMWPAGAVIKCNKLSATIQSAQRAPAIGFNQGRSNKGAGTKWRSVCIPTIHRNVRMLSKLECWGLICPVISPGIQELCNSNTTPHRHSVIVNQDGRLQNHINWIQLNIVIHQECKNYSQTFTYNHPRREVPTGFHWIDIWEFAFIEWLAYYGEVLSN